MTPLAIIGAVALALGLYLSALACVRAAYRRRGQALDERQARRLRAVLDDGNAPPLRMVQGGKREARK